uniref:Uncharacterized protein n=1 Tax=Salmonella sp. 14 TaxID=1179812 RepID=I3W2Y6_9ENTR|nr:hypothetical protein [Salmonella sp. 14]
MFARLLVQYEFDAHLKGGLAARGGITIFRIVRPVGFDSAIIYYIGEPSSIKKKSK